MVPGGAYDAIEDMVVPDDLEQPLLANLLAHELFHAFSASTKKQLLWWVASARRSETRAKRIAQLVDAAGQNRNPITYTPKRDSKRARITVRHARIRSEIVYCDTITSDRRFTPSP